jgi:hypothetical protein
MVFARSPVEHSQCAGSLFLISLPFPHTPFGSLGAFLCPARSYGQAVPVSHLCQLVYSTSLHNIRDGISGYIIQQKDAVKPRSALKGKLRHYDVIIYNRLDSPILWTEMSPDHSLSGRIRAIPAEYVHAVLEVKSTFNATHIAKAFNKLNELAPLLGIDDINEPYKQYIPTDFYTGMIFFELPEKGQGTLQLLNKLLPANCLRGF